MIPRKLAIGAACTAAAWTLAPGALAWGPVGHETIAIIAQDRLTPKARQALEGILGRDFQLAEVANWADQIRQDRPETAGWHFVDIPDRKPGIGEADEPTFCARDNCVVSQIDLDEALLANPSVTGRPRREALKFLIHFVGDVHQPLHCADDDDRGGNKKIVLFKRPGPRSRRGTKINLHALWDRLLELQTTDSPRDLASDLEERITDDEVSAWQRGTAADWAWESFQMARDTIYNELDEGPTTTDGVPLPSDYASTKMRDIVNTQLEKAGVRLAWVLNGLFK